MKPSRQKPDNTNLKHFPLKYVILFHIVVLASTIAVLWYIFPWNHPVDQKESQGVGRTSTMVQVRNSDYSFIKPLRLSDIPNESEKLQSLKQEINLMIFDKEKAGLINNASVYFRMMNDGTWFCINADRQYRAGSLIKVPILIYYLKQAETDPSLLSRKLVYKKSARLIPKQSFEGESITPGKEYTIKELLESMIKNSDNYATSLLNNKMNVDGFLRVFSDLGIKKPDLKDINYYISSTDYSKFLRILYNSTYLTPKSSEYAMSLLSQCSFKEGLVKNLPERITVAHKFGEANDVNNTELSESGIIYNGPDPYLITIMVNGKDLPQDAAIISDISALVFSRLKK